jgi:hypothetical protein
MVILRPLCCRHPVGHYDRESLDSQMFGACEYEDGRAVGAVACDGEAGNGHAASLLEKRSSSMLVRWQYGSDIQT